LLSLAGKIRSSSGESKEGMSVWGGPDGQSGVMRAACGASHVPSSHGGMVPSLILFNRIFWQGTGMERYGELALKRFSRPAGETVFSRSEREGGGPAPFPQKECFGV